MRLVSSWFGSFLLVEDEVVAHKLFPMEPGAIADRMERIDDWKVLPEERSLAEDPETFMVHERRLEELGGTYVEDEPPTMDPVEYGVPLSLLREAMLEVGRRQMRAAPGPEDHLAQAVDAYDDLSRVLNRLRERLRRWYGLHAPELERLVRPSEYAGLIADNPDRESIPGVDLTESVGGPLGPDEAAELRGLAGVVVALESAGKGLEDYITERAGILSPNLSRVVGPLIAARLLVLAGGSERLAKMPAGTVQTLGAEKALFRHLKTGKRPPKHGVLYQHPLVHTAPRWQRGKIARAMAAKAVIAARVDWAGDRFIGDELRDAVQTSVEHIRTRYPDPPKARGRQRTR